MGVLAPKTPSDTNEPARSDQRSTGRGRWIRRGALIALAAFLLAVGIFFVRYGDKDDGALFEPFQLPTTIEDAQDWLAAHADSDGLPFDVDASTTSGAEAVALADTLDAYNNGDIGPGHCE